MVELTGKDKRRLAKLERIEKAEIFMEELLEVVCGDCTITEPAGRGCGYGISNTKPLLDFIMNRVEKFKD